MNEGSESPNNQERFPAFEEQFSNKQKIETLGATIEAVDVRPERMKTEVPVIFAPGWGETPKILKPSLEVLTKSGRRALSFAHPSTKTDVLPREEYPIEELRKAEAILSVLKERGIKKTDAIAHSEGGINILIAAALRPEKFRNIVLVAPGGLIGADKFPKLAGRFTMSMIQGALRSIMNFKEAKRLTPAGTGVAHYIGRNPAKALGEAVAISASETQEMLRDLHGHGIGISIIHGVDDPVFPMERIQDTLRQSDTTRQEGKPDYVDGFYSVKGNHAEIFVQAEQYTKLAAQALDDLEAKRAHE